MQASNLLLDHYYLDVLHFALNEHDGGVLTGDVDIPLTAEDVNTTVEIGQNPDDELEFFFRLTIRLDDKDSKFPYDFRIRLSGFFKVSPDCAPEMREPLATVNGPSVLYGAAREMLAMVSARSRVVSVFLPPIRFTPWTKKPPPEQEMKALSEGSKPKRQGTKKVAKKK